MLKKKFSKVVLSGLFASLALGLAACGNEGNDLSDSAADGGMTPDEQRIAALVPSAEGQGVEANALTVVTGGNVRLLDPHFSNDSASSLVNNQIFDQLVVQSEDLSLGDDVILPGLATSWELLEDGVTYEFNLRPNVTFHNGEVLTADDVAFSLERASQSPMVAEIVGMIDQVTVIDELTVQVSTAVPFAPFLRHLAHPAASIMNRLDVESVEAAGIEYGTTNTPIGTGAFKFVDALLGSHTTLATNQDFWGEVAVFDELILRNVADANSRSLQLETGEADIVLSIQSSDIDRVRNNPDVNLISVEGLSTNFITLNTSKPYLDDVRIRQAINYAIDTELLLETIMEGIGVLARGPIGPNVFGFNENLPMPTVDLDRARELLAEAGVADGFQINMWANSETAERVAIATAVQAMLAEINIDVIITQLDWPTLLDSSSNNEHEIVILGWGSITADADYGLWSVYHGESPIGAGNRSVYQNLRVDELLYLARNTDDAAARLAYYAEAQELIVYDVPNIFLNHNEVFAGLQPNVGGFVVNPTQSHRFNTVWFAE